MTDEGAVERVKLTVSEASPPPTARAAFDELSALHEDQAIVRVDRTRYVDEDGWGFRVTYRTRDEFVQSTSLRAVERTMSRVAPTSFERRVTRGDG